LGIRFVKRKFANVPISGTPVGAIKENLIWSQGRPLPAERLIYEAIEIYQKQIDSRGLGHAYREYGDFLLSNAVSKSEKYYRENGFRDESVTFENRFAKSKEYFTKALENYQAAEMQLRKSEKFDELTNLYFNMGWSYYRLGDRNNSCEYYDKSLVAYNENIQRNPSAKPQVNGSATSAIVSNKTRAGCDGGIADKEMSDTKKMELEKLGGGDCSESAPKVSAEIYFLRDKTLVAMNEYKGAMQCLMRAQEEENDTQLYRDTCFQIATMYELGWGVDKDMEKSKAWLKKAGL
jgi:tetratricopeptide (TPR) repeat protein